jgi:hypothetical protein
VECRRLGCSLGSLGAAEGGKSGVKVAREFFILFFCATIAFLLGNGYYKSFGSGVLTTVKGFTASRDKEPVKYWIGMAIGTLTVVILASGAALMAFLICVHLFGISK